MTPQGLGTQFTSTVTRKTMNGLNTPCQTLSYIIINNVKVHIRAIRVIFQTIRVEYIGNISMFSEYN